MSIAQNLFVNKLEESLPRYELPVSSSAVIVAGATGLKQLASSPTILRKLRLSYTVSIRNALVFALAAACAAFPFACSMQWFNIKSIAKERFEQQQAEEVIEDGAVEHQKVRQSLEAAATDKRKPKETGFLKS